MRTEPAPPGPSFFLYILPLHFLAVLDCFIDPTSSVPTIFFFFWKSLSDPAALRGKTPRLRKGKALAYAMKLPKVLSEPLKQLVGEGRNEKYVRECTELHLAGQGKSKVELLARNPARFWPVPSRTTVDGEFRVLTHSSVSPYPLHPGRHR